MQRTRFSHDNLDMYNEGVACNAPTRFINSHNSPFTTHCSLLTAHYSLALHHAAITAAALATFKLSAPRLH